MNAPATAQAPLGAAASTADASPAPLWISQLTLQAFRNYGEATLEADERPVVLIGDNGAGKTNLIEALSLLTPGRGLRAARLGDLQREGGNTGAPGSGGTWAVSAEVQTPEGPHRLGTGADPRPQVTGAVFRSEVIT